VDNNRNLILAGALSFALFFGWQFAMTWFYPEQPHAAAPVATVSTASTDKLQGTAPAPKIRRTREGGVERDFAAMREELSAALTRAREGKGDPPRRRKR
jgi:hypothetical protein